VAGMGRVRPFEGYQLAMVVSKPGSGTGSPTPQCKAAGGHPVHLLRRMEEKLPDAAVLYCP
jgi:hypothetical protein